ncbi:MAG TPA: DUF4238 domain-containing protein [Pseudolabrys sp.]
MPLDHFVSQVHLRNFAAPEMDGMLRAIKKSDLKTFNTRSQDVCRIQNGNTNPFLQQPRVIEEFLKGVEPCYNESVQKFRDDKIDQAAIHCVAGFVAYVITCSPTAMRLNSGPLKAMVNATAEVLDRSGKFSKAPAGSLGGKSLTELLADGAVSFDVDQKYPQAIGIDNIKHHVSMFGNSKWEVLLNFNDGDPYFSSDYPVAVETFDFNTPVNRVVPLAPDLAVRIVPDAARRGAQSDLSFSNFNYTRRAQKRQSVIALNRCLVQCAEDFVFHRDNEYWVKPFVTKNQPFRLDSVKERIQMGGRVGLAMSVRIVETPSSQPAPQSRR